MAIISPGVYTHTNNGRTAHCGKLQGEMKSAKTLPLGWVAVGSSSGKTFWGNDFDNFGLNQAMAGLGEECNMPRE
jgi:hypothetical protein